MTPQERLIVALDVESVADARAMAAALGETVSFYKVGMELAYAPGGFDFALELKAAGKRVFLDLKLHDIGVTVERAARQIARLGVDFLTVHAFPQTMAAARQGVSGALKLLAVTVMTSYDDADLKEAGYAFGVAELVTRRARQAKQAQVDGLILSPVELAAIRPLVGADMLLYGLLLMLVIAFEPRGLVAILKWIATRFARSSGEARLEHRDGAA